MLRRSGTARRNQIEVLGIDIKYLNMFFNATKSQPSLAALINLTGNHEYSEHQEGR